MPAAACQRFLLLNREDDTSLVEDHLRPRRRSGVEPPRRPEPQARINDAIRVPRVRLIGEDGQQLGIKQTDEAREYAYGKDLDLVEVAAQADPPVAKVMDYGKYRYEQEQKAKQARKNQTQIHVKEIKLRPKIGIHDYETKKGHVVRFLNQRAKVKVTIMFRGREREHPDRGRDLLMRLAEDVKEIGPIETQPLLEGRNMTMVLGPTKNAGVKRDAETEDKLGSEEEVQGDGNGEAPAAEVGEAENKSPKQKRAFSKDQPVAAANEKTVKQMLGRRKRCPRQALRPRAQEAPQGSRRPRATGASRARTTRTRRSRSSTRSPTPTATARSGSGVPPALDHPDQRGRAGARALVQPVHLGLKAADVELDRKILADLAVTDPAEFGELAEQAKAALPPRLIVPTRQAEIFGRQAAYCDGRAPLPTRRSASFDSRRIPRVDDLAPDLSLGTSPLLGPARRPPLSGARAARRCWTTSAARSSGTLRVP